MMTKKEVMRRLKGTMLRRLHGMITCREFEEFVLRYLDDELPARQAKIFEWHMRLCRECREYLAAYKRTIEIGKVVFDSANESIPDDVPEDLIRAVLDARKG